MPGRAFLASVGRERPSLLFGITHRAMIDRRSQSVRRAADFPVLNAAETLMDWILFIVIASTAVSDNKAVHTSAVPMASLQLCTTAKDKLAEAYKKVQSPNFAFIGECLQAR